jgi:hypothetical protein
MGEWTYSTIILDLSIIDNGCAQGKCPITHWTGGWVGPEVILDRREKSLALTVNLTPAVEPIPILTEHTQKI